MRLVLSFMFLCLTGTASLADVEACKALWHKAPTQLETLPQLTRRNLEKDHPGHGYGVSYKGREGTFSLYLYDARHTKITDQILMAQFNQAFLDMQKVAEMRGFALTNPRGFKVLANKETALLYLQSPDDKGRMHLVGLAERQDCMVKLRFTTPKGEEAAVDRFLSMGNTMLGALN